MIKHVVLLTWIEGVTKEQIDSVTSAFRELGEQIDEIEDYEFGPDAEIYKGNADYALVAEFKNKSNLKAYVMHPKHQDLLSKVTGPILKSFQSVQFGLPE